MAVVTCEPHPALASRNERASKVDSSKDEPQSLATPDLPPYCYTGPTWRIMAYYSCRPNNPGVNLDLQRVIELAEWPIPEMGRGFQGLNGDLEGIGVYFHYHRDIIETPLIVACWLLLSEVSLEPRTRECAGERIQPSRHHSRIACKRVIRKGRSTGVG